MNTIPFEKWTPDPHDPDRQEYAGQRTAQEVFEELKYRLASMGYLPDEYFLLDICWEDGREIPKDADIFCTTDYGGSEGVYLDVYLKWYDEQQKKSVTRSFITGKTLGENGNDLDRMFLVASAITKAFHGDNPTHARYMKIDGVEEDTGGRVVHLSQREEKVLLDALVERRERQEKAMDQTERLLRRMTGSITAYMDAVGRRPLRLSDYDRTVLAIRDGELSAFKDLYPRAMEAHADDLLIEAAGRPGVVGRQMTLLLLESGRQFPEPVYHAACKKAIGINDPQKVSFLLEQADSCVPGLSASFRGELASYAYTDHRFIATEIIRQCSEAQISAAPSRLLEQFAMDKDWLTLDMLVEKGISGGTSAARTIRMLTCQQRDQRIAEDLLKKRMWVDVNDYSALRACIMNDAVDVAKLLLDGGMDYNGYLEWAKPGSADGHEETIAALAEHWQEMKAGQEQSATPEDGPAMGGMTLG